MTARTRSFKAPPQEPAPPAFHPASFRDPGGRLVEWGDRLFRFVNPYGVENARLFLNARSLDAFRDRESLVRTRMLPESEADAVLRAFQAAAATDHDSDPATAPPALILEHECVPFSSYPYEWPPAMLAAAGHLTLDLAESLLSEGLGLKDATPFNIMFNGPRPVFLDALSVERRDPLDPLWIPMSQFERTFIYPLLARKYCGLTLAQSLAWCREGLEPEHISALAGPIRRWFPPFLTNSTLPTLLNRRAERCGEALYYPRRTSSAEQARFVLERTFRRLRCSLRHATRGANPHSIWTGYHGAACHYSERDRKAKRDFVNQVLAETRPTRVLDLGANEGEYSLMATVQGASVVAVDKDDAVAGRLWSRAAEQSAPVLPLVVDLTAPSPALGWQNQETKSFVSRGFGNFDGVMALALLHHLEAESSASISHLVSSLSRFAGRWLLLEMIDREDPVSQRAYRKRSAAPRPTATSYLDPSIRSQIIRSLDLTDSGRQLVLLAS